MDITEEKVRALFAARMIDATKHDFGHVLIIGGSYGMIGAVILAALAALRSGAGLVSILAPRCGYMILQTSVPEAMVVPSSDDEHLEVMPDIDRFNLIAVGPGLGRHKGTAGFVDLLLHKDKPLIIDADALNIIAEHGWQKKIPKGSLLTPNLREFERLFSSHDQHEQVLIEKAQELNICILLKGAGTQIAFPNGNIFTNTTGNPGMAKGGSGDVLTGMIAGLLGRLNDLKYAAIAGTYLHGLAGNIAAEKYHIESMLPTDLITCIPDAFKKIN
jgi:ADP-dependent NAD(P)H-hydrate dehydratase / NAD(P)H-hydrate epimerase